MAQFPKTGDTCVRQRVGVVDHEIRRKRSMEKVTGFGGFFFRSQNPEALNEWYATMLGIGPESGQDAWQQEAGPTVFQAFPADTGYFGRAEQGFMFNFRVDNLD